MRGRIARTVRGCALVMVGGVGGLIASCAAPGGGIEVLQHGPAAFQPGGKERKLPVGAKVQPAVDMTNGAVAVSDTVEAVIFDSRTIQPQIQVTGPWKGRIQDLEALMEAEGEHGRKAVMSGPPNNLKAGSVDGAEITRPGPLFPGLTQTPWTPPDPTLAVGRSHVLETVNMAVSWYDKATGALQFSVNLDNTGNPGFFETVGAGAFTFDPKCFYDPYEDRFVIVVLEQYDSPQQSFVDIAVSDDGDPNGVWFKYRTNSLISITGQNYWVDYPGFGYDQQAYYVTGNYFGFSGGFGGVMFRIFNKTPLLTGAPATFSTLRDGAAGSAQPAQHYGTPIAPFFVSTESTTQLRFQAIRNPLTAPTLSTTLVTIPVWSFPAGASNVGGTVNTVDDRPFNAHWRDGEFYTSHTIRIGSQDISRWYHIRTNNWPTSGTPTLVQSGNINPGGSRSTFFPAIYSNRCEDVGMVVGSSTPTTAPDVRVTGRRATDTLGTMATPTQVVIGPNGVNGRWGDYFGMQVDPVDDTTFWYVGEYQNGSGWLTWLGSFRISCPADRNCDGFVDAIDYDQFVTAWLVVDVTNGDYNHDDFVDAIDYDMFISDWLAGGC